MTSKPPHEMKARRHMRSTRTPKVLPGVAVVALVALLLGACGTTVPAQSRGGAMPGADGLSPSAGQSLGGSGLGGAANGVGSSGTQNPGAAQNTDTASPDVPARGGPGTT